nr:unnamed protein product [Digitaria exilis]
MPRLESIEFTFPVQDMREIPYSNVGLVNLLSIQDVTVLFNYGGASEEDLEEAEAALGHEVELHPNRPTLRIVTADKSDVEGHLKEVPVKSDRYKIDGPIAKPVTTTVFPCLSAQYMKAEELIGIEDTINELTNILTERNEPSMEQGKIVSIVGPGGLGKTTLARAVYEKLRAEFDCCAFVTVSQNPDMKKLFKCMLYQLGKKNDANIHDARTLDERLLVYELSEFLQHRRYERITDQFMPIWTRAPSGTGSLTSLEELSTLRIQDSTTIIEDLSNQTGLRVLGIECHTVWNIKRFEKSLIECLNKLQNIHTLSISVVGECKLDAWVVPRHLRRLELMGCSASRLPVWLKPLLLLNLSFLSIEVRNLRQEDLEILGWLPALVYLDLEVGNQNLQILRRFVIGDCSFPCLVHCTLRGYMRPVVFQQGAMPRLARLHLAFPVRETREIAGGFDLGLGNLTMLQDVTFLLRRLGASKGEVEEAEAALRHAIQIHPNRPKVEILC